MQLYRQTLLSIHSASWVQSDQPASCLSTTERRPSPLSLNLPTWLFTSDVIPEPWSIESTDLCFKAVNVHLLLEWHVHRTIHAVSSCCGDLVMFLHIPILLYICKHCSGLISYCFLFLFYTGFHEAQANLTLTYN